MDSSKQNDPPDGETLPIIDPKASPDTIPLSKKWFVFWLLVPSVASLGYFLIYEAMGSLPDVAEAGAVLSSALSLIGSIYCAVWIVAGMPWEKRVRVVVGTLLTIAFLAVNLVISIAGCVAHVAFH